MEYIKCIEVVGKVRNTNRNNNNNNRMTHTLQLRENVVSWTHKPVTLHVLQRK
jgi:hypothetical protein